MLSNVNYRLTCFADYSLLEYNKADVISILNAFDSVVLTPAVIDEISLSGLKSQRMQFASQDGLLLININSNRIDIQIMSKEKTGFAESEIESIKINLCSYIEKLYTVFAERVPLPNRLAWFTIYVYFETTKDERKAFRNKFLKPLKFFNKDRLDDLFIRYGAKRNVMIGKRDERLNVMTTVKHLQIGTMQEEKFNGYQIEYDINTWQFNIINRFSMDDFSEFCNKAIKIQDELNREVLP